eukprot:899632-Prymnesium_polylepis.1
MPPTAPTLSPTAAAIARPSAVGFASPVGWDEAAWEAELNAARRALETDRAWRAQQLAEEQ